MLSYHRLRDIASVMNVLSRILSVGSVLHGAWVHVYVMKLSDIILCWAATIKYGSQRVMKLCHFTNSAANS